MARDSAHLNKIPLPVMRLHKNSMLLRLTALLFKSELIKARGQIINRKVSPPLKGFIQKNINVRQICSNFKNCIMIFNFINFFRLNGLLSKKKFRRKKNHSRN